tara:strand:- start:4388 stop:4744 length:357 start_codon:yes stop_codon:yes gene_type:complete
MSIGCLDIRKWGDQEVIEELIENGVSKLFDSNINVFNTDDGWHIVTKNKKRYYGKVIKIYNGKCYFIECNDKVYIARYNKKIKFRNIVRFEVEDATKSHCSMSFVIAINCIIQNPKNI